MYSVGLAQAHPNKPSQLTSHRAMACTLCTYPFLKILFCYSVILTFPISRFLDHLTAMILQITIEKGHTCMHQGACNNNHDLADILTTEHL